MPAPDEDVAAAAEITSDSNVFALGSDAAPFIYFELAPMAGSFSDGICRIALSANRQNCVDPSGRVLTDRVIVAHLIGGRAAMKQLREAIDAALLLTQETPSQRN